MLYGTDHGFGTLPSGSRSPARLDRESSAVSPLAFASAPNQRGANRLLEEELRSHDLQLLRSQRDDRSGTPHSVLGSGGIAVVYHCAEPADRSFPQREVAVKIIQFNDTESRTRLLREARALAQISHPGIVPVYRLLDLGAHGLGFVMPVFPGGTLHPILEQPSWSRADRITAFGAIIATLAALDVFHGRGILHRDVKPANILLNAQRFAALGDLGFLERLPGKPAPGETLLRGHSRSRSGSEADPLDEVRLPSIRTITDDPRFTRDGRVVGTPHWMSPEQTVGRPLTPASDLYPVGVMLYWLVTGSGPFARGPHTALSLETVPETIASGKPIHPRWRAPFLGGLQCQLLMRALATNPAERFQSAYEMAQALAEAFPDRQLRPYWRRFQFHGR